MRRRTSIPVAAAILAAPIWLAPANASAEQCGLDAQAHEPSVQWLAHQYELSLREATCRLARQDAVVSFTDALEQRLGPAYAGAWIDHGNGGRVVVNLVGPAPAAEAVAREFGVADLLETRRVRHSVARLETIRSALARSVGAATAMGTGLDHSGNQVVATVPAGHAAGVRDAARRLNAQHAEAVRVEVGDAYGFAACSPPWCDPPLRAGVGITNGGICTAGFLARQRADDNLVLMTAGHCVTDDEGGGRFVVDGLWQTRIANQTVRNVGYGMSGYVDSRGDAGYIDVADPLYWGARGLVLVTAQNNGIYQTVYNDTYPIYRFGGSTQNMIVCKTGRVAKTDCGVVSELGHTAPDGVGQLALVTGGCVKGGDSGGPVYRANTAYGLVAGGYFPNGDKTLCSTKWTYQGITGAQNVLGLDIILE